MKQTQAVVIVNQKSHLGEGALWDNDLNVLYWVDILNHKVFMFDPKTSENKEYDVSYYPSTIVPWKNQEVAITLENGFARLNLENGSFEILKEVEQDMKANRFNDGKCDPAGRFWAGTMDFNITGNKGALYMLDRECKVTKQLDNISCSNGIVWSKDNSTMFYIDSLTQEIHAFDYNLENGKISNRRTIVKIPKDVGLPDGMSIDSNGMLWVALYFGGKVNCYDPKKGELIDSIEIPGANLVTSCAFGGAELNELYITTASCDYSDSDWVRWPNAGCLFKAEMAVKGVPSYRFQG
jgi:sugar lactone lactonase YvrE